MRQIRKVGKLTKVIVEHPDGGLLSLPADETNLPSSEAGVLVAGTSRLFDPEKLLRLTEWVAAHSPLESEKWFSVQQHQELEQKKTDDTTACTTKSFTKRKRRTPSTSNKADSTISGQNAVHRNTSSQPAQE